MQENVWLLFLSYRGGVRLTPKGFLKFIRALIHSEASYCCMNIADLTNNVLYVNFELGLIITYQKLVTQIKDQHSLSIMVPRFYICS